MSIDIHALSGAYAVDALDGSERAEFERHLAECVSCQHEVDSLREAAAALSGAVETAPSDRLRAAVLAGIGEVRPLPPLVSVSRAGRTRRRWAAGSLVLAASVASAVAVSHPWPSSHVSMSAADRVMSAADVQVVRSAVVGGGSLTWYRSGSVGRAVVTSGGLKPLPNSQVYELWLQRPDRSMAPAGYLPAGATTVVLTGQARTALGAGITVEPAGGSARPTTTPLALVAFARA
ncbi:hypothetical protein Back2_11460 [Nocardioides baekrokdamisoli]|uniref:Regulator of SigK n=1 Tax=Nocardioides baekrokdamisoli TaxID=1804624 RepID=A0A3G9J1K1_9ACTN|nr:anti-sigma factor [Nocardioides baekrokdamisoli]BBH16859.1 hypothetical protein Back2_11460 [Nocardioides baekrokdamisoli]